MQAKEPATRLHWTENDSGHAALWRSEAGNPPPRSVIVADDRISADAAYRHACEGRAILWRGDFQNARQLLHALMRRVGQKPRKARPAPAPASMTEAFHLHRQAQARRARILGMLLIPLDADYRVPLRRAPDIREACEQVYGPVTASSEPSVLSLRELQSLVGAFEWRKNGVEIPALGARIHPHYGVFSPVRGEYVDLVAQAPLPGNRLAFDIGTGTGVLSAMLARRGVQRIVATDLDPRAIACARDNLQRLGLQDRVELLQADMFPDGTADIVICNPPWVPARPSSPIEAAVYDQDSRMLRSFLAGLAAHLAPGGEGWLILSDFAEHLGLRTRDEMLGWIAEAGLTVAGRVDIRPRHGKARDAEDSLHAARAAEVTSLWRLRVLV
ncbi:methyltransferase [Noviherbaspirillum galbum]|uniref:Class I SAM-dependent methyltransferase n=1 Tax=Noviherbaspirillum galbum TaxID=2709383 RepID=A0A6B3SQS2_9BURK|nr:class I SAM-dependent methyltransferase [Noviherbaspirillum galbum]NEX63124.1 class I SAM-dependent methyltransferase [Noviherbaspirillum galbum]